MNRSIRVSEIGEPVGEYKGDPVGDVKRETAREVALEVALEVARETALEAARDTTTGRFRLVVSEEKTAEGESDRYSMFRTGLDGRVFGRRDGCLERMEDMFKGRGSKAEE